MKPPPLLLGVTLLFWGWQTTMFLPGALLAVIVESARVFKVRWDFSDDDFGRVWAFCSLLLLGTALYAFTANEGPASVEFLFGDSVSGNPQAATVASARTAAAVLCWLPLIFYPFLLAQVFSTRETIPFATSWLILQRRWKQAKQLGPPPGPGSGFNIGYPYFCATLLAASFHPAEDNSYFWGFCALLTWALWMHRPRRFGLVVWSCLLLLVGAGGFFGQRGVSQLQQYVTNLNPQWLSRFMRRAENGIRSRTAIGLIGNIKTSGRIVIRLEPDKIGRVPAYLREASYRIYLGQSWLAGSSREDFKEVPEDSPTLLQGFWTMLPEKRTNTTVQIACYLDGYDNNSPAGLLPLPIGTTRLEKLFAFSLQVSSAGAVLAHGPGLVIFDARYGPGESVDMPPGFGTTNNPVTQRLIAEGAGLRPARRRWRRNPDGDNMFENRPARRQPTANQPIGTPDLRMYSTNEDLVVPAIEQPALDSVIGELHLKNRPLPEVLRTLSGFFNEKFTYRTWQNPAPNSTPDETPLSRFLLKTRAGHCEYFATATVLLLRQLNFPARYATGFSVHEKSGAGYVVRLSDAHAWTLAWDDARKVWFDFETTPASWVAAERKRLSPLQWLSDAWARIVFEFSKFRNGQGKLQQYLVWVVAPGLVLLLYQIIFRRRRRRLGHQSPDDTLFAKWPGLDSDFYRLEKQIAERGVKRGAAEPLQDWLRRALDAPGIATLRSSLEELLRLHYRHRFDPLGLDAPGREALQRETLWCLEQIAQIPHATTAGPPSAAPPLRT